MRVSCTSFARFFDLRGNYGLLVNKNQWDQGKTVLSPVGGALEVDRAKGDKIMGLLGLTPADFDKPPTAKVELRFTLDDHLLDMARREFRKWDTRPHREIREELVDETKIVTMEELSGGYELKFAGYNEERRPSRRSGKAKGRLTLRLAAIYDLLPGRRLEEKLSAAARVSHPFLYYVSREEIEEGLTVGGVEISPTSRLLLNPKR